MLFRSSGNPCLELFNPQGARIAGRVCQFSAFSTNRIDATLVATGTFSILVSEDGNDQTIDYSLTLERLAPPSPTASPISFGQILQDEINIGVDVDPFIFSGIQGHVITIIISRTGGTGNPCLELFDPAGTRTAGRVCQFSAFSTNRIDATLAATGTFSILVSEDGNNQTVEYSISLTCIAQCVPPPSDLSQCHSPRSLNVSALTGASPIERFISVGDTRITNCALNVSAPFTTSVKLLNGADWLSVSPMSGTFFPGSVSTVTATVNPAALGGPGTYQAVIEISVPSLETTLKIPATLTVSSPRPQISLSWNSFAFQTVENTPAPPPQSFRIFNGVPGTVDWSISLAEDSGSFPAWLNISPLSGTAGNSAGQGSTVTVSVDPAGLTAGSTNIAYTALAKVTAANASNSPQLVSVTFHVVRITAAPVALLTSYGFVFRHVQGSPAPEDQNFTLSNTGGGFVTAALSATTQTGGNWLSLSKTSSTANTDTSTGPDVIGVRVNPAGMVPGFYRGTVRAVFTAQRTNNGATVSLPDQEVDVVLIVEPSVAPAVAPLRTDVHAADCAPTRMELVGATVGNGLNVPVSFPQVLLTQVLDDCGQGVTGATAVAVADGQTVALSEVGGGLYSGNWTPQQANASATVAFSIFHPTFASVQQSYTVSAVTASGGTVLPTLFPQGVVEGAGFSQGRPLVPGGIISLFGARLAPDIAVASVIPLERNLAGTSVRIGNVDAPLYFVSPDQINAQLPFEAIPGETVSIVLNVNGGLTTPQLYQISPAQPGVFKTATAAAVLDERFDLVTVQNPARIGKVIQIFANGLGFTDPPVDTGAGSPAFSDVEIPVTVTIGGVDAPVQYQGLAPGYVGLYQVNAIVPQGVTPGDAVSLVITQDGIPSNPDFPATLPVAE